MLEQKWTNPYLVHKAHPESVEPRTELKQDISPRHPPYLVKTFTAGIVITAFGLFYLFVSFFLLKGRMDEVAWVVLAVGTCAITLSLLQGEVVADRHK
jgi:hypothetical protein